MMIRRVLFVCMVSACALALPRGAQAAPVALMVVSSATFDSGGEDVATAVAVDAGGGIFVTGDSSKNFLTVQYTKDLLPVQYRTFDTGNDDVPRGIVVDNGSAVAIAGEITAGGVLSFLTVRYSPNLLTMLSSATETAPFGAKAAGIAVDSDGGLYVTGFNNLGLNDNIHTVVYTSQLNRTASQVFDTGMNERARAVAVSPGRIVAVAGVRNDGATDNVCVVLYDTSLSQLAQTAWDSGDQDAAVGAAWTPDGYLLVLVQTGSANKNFVILKYDASLSLVSSVTYDSGLDDFPSGIAVGSDGTIAVAGYQDDGASYNFVTLKYTPSLSLTATGIYDSGAKDQANGVAVDGDGSIIVTGQVFGVNDNYFTVKYLGGPQLASAGPLYQGEASALRLSGRNFAAGTSVAFPSGVTLSTLTVASSQLLTGAVLVDASFPIGVTTITVVNAGGESTVRTDLITVEARKWFTVDGGAVTVPTRSGALSITVPSGALSQSSTMTFTAVPGTGTATGQQTVGVPVLVGLVPAQAVLSPPATVGISYTDSQVVGTDENRLSIAYYDEITRQWVAVESTVDAALNRVTCPASVVANRVFTLLVLPPVPGELSQVSVYPNPYKPGSGGDFDDPGMGEGIVFSQLVPSFKLRIFNIAGELIFSTDGRADVFGRYLWNARTSRGDPAASGVYVYVIEDATRSSERARGKLSIIR